MCAYKPPPKTLPGFPDAKAVTPKTLMNGVGDKKRKRWVDQTDGTIYEWDYQHGTIEKYDKQGRHLGEFHLDGTKAQGPIPKRRVDP